jgi:hypothetical protein
MSDIVERLRAPLGIMECAERDMPDGTKERRWFVALEAADEITRLIAENQRLKSEALFTAISVLPEKDAEIETLTARVAELEAALVDLLWYTEALEPFVYDDEERPKAHASVALARAALSQPTPMEKTV